MSDRGAYPVGVLANRMLVVSGALHYTEGGRIYSYTPYVREVDSWAHLFEEVRILGPFDGGRPPPGTTPFASPMVTLSPLPPTGGDCVGAKLRQLRVVPLMVGRLVKELRSADAVQVRAPANLALLAIPLAPVFSRRLHCKYAGMWGRFPGEPLTSRLQRWMLRSRWWHGPVGVYGRSNSDPAHVVDAFSASLTRSQIGDHAAIRDRCRARRRSATPRGPVRVLFVGRLSKQKHVDSLIRAIGNVASLGSVCGLTVVGDGPEHGELERLTAELGLEDSVRFLGSLPVNEVVGLYEESDVLVLPSESEGWPKVLIEAMAFGLVVVGNDRGLVPRILADGRGITIPPGDVQRLAEVIQSVHEDPGRHLTAAEQAARWASAFTLESFVDDFESVLRSHWPVAKPIVRRAGASSAGVS